MRERLREANNGPVHSPEQLDTDPEPVKLDAGTDPGSYAVAGPRGKGFTSPIFFRHF